MCEGELPTPHLGLLHHAQLRQHRDGLEVHAECPHDLVMRYRREIRISRI